jgi:hypothetical protein
MIDQYGGFLNGEGRENMGTLIIRQDKKVRTKLRATIRTFRECRVTEEELRRHWKDQKEAQVSMHSRMFHVHLSLSVSSFNTSLRCSSTPAARAG